VVLSLSRHSEAVTTHQMPETDNKESMSERPIARRPDMQEKKNTDIELGFAHSAERTQEIEKKTEEAKPQLYGAKILVSFLHSIETSNL
jgi:hypothetical protein